MAASTCLRCKTGSLSPCPYCSHGHPSNSCSVCSGNGWSCETCGRYAIVPSALIPVPEEVEVV